MWIWRLEDGVKSEAGTAEEDQADEAAGAVEAVGASRDRSDLAVEAFDGTVAEAGSHEADDALEVTAQGSGEFLERREPRAPRPADPVAQLLVSVRRIA